MKKKVVFVVNNFMIGGAERLIVELVAGLKDRFDVSVVCVCGAGPLDGRLKEMRMLVYYTGSRRMASSRFFEIVWILRLPITFFKTVRFFFRLKPDVVVTSLYQADILGGLAAYLTGVGKRIVIQHDHEPMGGLIRWLKRKVMTLSSGVIANSKATENFLKDYWGVDQQKITVIPNGVSLERFRETSQRDVNTLKTHAVSIGALGRLEPVKGLNCLIEAVDLLKKDGLSPAVCIAGTGSREASLKKAVMEKGLSNVRFLGMAEDPAIFFQGVDVVVIPSLREGFGLVALEALLSETCVVASDIPSFRALITNGRNGFLFPPQDQELLARILKNLISDRTILQGIRHGIKEWIETESWQYGAKVMIEKYADVLSKSTASIS